MALDLRLIIKRSADTTVIAESVAVFASLHQSHTGITNTAQMIIQLWRQLCADAAGRKTVSCWALP